MKDELPLQITQAYLSVLLVYFLQMYFLSNFYAILRNILNVTLKGGVSDL